MPDPTKEIKPLYEELRERRIMELEVCDELNA